jgi:hypothetical protein
MHFVTYANKRQGLFDELVKNEFGIKVDVLGMGKKWNGFTDKYKGVLEYCNTLHNDEYLVFLDGFDTKIQRDPRDVLELFRTYDCDILVSKDPTPFGQYISKKIFGTCNNGSIANSGMYMGSCKHIKEFVKAALAEKTDDDQRSMNTLCSKFNIAVDQHDLIFHNKHFFKKEKQTSLFVSYPGSGGGGIGNLIDRGGRALVEYSSYFKIEMACVLILVILVILLMRKKVR